MLQTTRKVLISILFLWFVVAILMTVFGTDLFFPFDFKMTEREELYRYKTVRFAAGCLLAYAVFRYLCALKAAPSLAIVFYFGVFYLIGGLLFGYRDNMDLRDMQHLVFVAFLTLMIRFELQQRTKDDVGTFKRDHF